MLSAALCIAAGFNSIQVNASTPRGPIPASNRIVKSTSTASAHSRAIGTEASDYESITDWKSIGTGRYSDGFVAWSVGDTGYEKETWSVEVEESESNPGLYRVVNPYAGCTYATDYNEVDFSKDYYMIVDATDPDAVFIPVFETGVMPYYANDQMVSGRSEGGAGKLANYEITFPAFTLACYVESDGWTTSNSDANFHLYLPGAKDYSASISASDMCSSNEANVSITTGTDIAYIRYKLSLNGEDANLSESMTPTDNTVSLDLNLDKDGMWQFSAYCYNADDEEKASVHTIFFVQNDNNDQWKSLGDATVTEPFVYSLFGGDFGPNEYTVEIQENNNTPGFFRLVNLTESTNNNNIPAYNDHASGHNHYLYIHTENPERVYFEGSPLGIDFGYGDMAVVLADGASGEYVKEDGIIGFSPSDMHILMRNEYPNRYAAKAEFVVMMPQNVAIDDIVVDAENALVEYFNLQGMKISEENATNGLYIMRQGNKVSKVIRK